jgi:phosphoribosylanthranilate isomerase
MIKSFEIKICGITNLDCMKAAIDSKVDYIGLVFFNKSPRNISFEIAKYLLKIRNNHSKIVALTVDPDDKLLSQIMGFVKPDFIQLHGQETPKRCKEIRNKFDIPIIKAIGIKNKQQLAVSKVEFELASDILLLDSPSSNLPGGNGNSFNWNILKNFDFKKKWMLAGGINLSNVKDALKTANPPIIDVSSGVEIQKGIKCPELIKNFVTECRNI